MNVELKPCPFCGDMAKYHGMEALVGWVINVMCERCGARTRNYDDEAEATEAWNRRAR